MKIVCTEKEAIQLVKTCISAIYDDDCKCCVLHRFCREASEIDADADAIDALIKIVN